MLFAHLSLDTISSAGVQTVVADLLNGPRYQNPRYTRTVAPRRGSSLAGQSPYADVEDEITIDVFGATYGACVRNAEALWGILDQAAEWYAGVTTTAIQLRLRAACGEVGDLTTMVYGPAPGEAPGAFDPAEQPGAPPGERWVLRGVTLRFLTRGRLLRPREDAVNVTSSGNPTVETITWATSQGRVYAPVGLDMLTFSSVGNDDLYSFLLTAAAPNAITLVDATTQAPSAPFTNVNDAADFPYNGTNVRRYTPTGTTGDNWTFHASLNLQGYEQFAIIACVRNNSASVPFLLRPSFLQDNGLFNDIITEGPVTVVEAGYTDPQYVSLGTISLRGTSSFVTAFRVFCQVPTTSGSPTLDFSHFAIIALDAPGAKVLAIANSTIPAAIQAFPAEILNAARTGIVSNGVVTFANDAVGHAYRGDLEISVRDSSLYVCYLRTEADNWVLTNGGVKSNIRFAAYRRRAFLSPQ